MNDVVLLPDQRKGSVLRVCDEGVNAQTYYVETKSIVDVPFYVDGETVTTDQFWIHERNLRRIS